MPAVMAPIKVDAPLNMDEIDRNMKFMPAHKVVVSCGTVTLDFHAQKVLIIRHKKYGIYQLPKGRRNIGEGFQEAALRETLEETGVIARPLALQFGTRATLPVLASSTTAPPALDPKSGTAGAGVGVGAGPGVIALDCPGASVRSDKDPDVVDGLVTDEFLAVCMLPDPQVLIPSTKLVYYFAAEADSSRQPEPRQAEDVDRHDAVWVSPAKAAELLRFEADRRVLRKALDDSRRTGYLI